MTCLVSVEIRLLPAEQSWCRDVGCQVRELSGCPAGKAVYQAVATRPQEVDWLEEEDFASAILNLKYEMLNPLWDESV